MIDFYASEKRWRRSRLLERRPDAIPLQIAALRAPRLDAIIYDICIGDGSEVAMAQILVRRVDEGVVERLRTRAKRDGRSLEEECRVSLARASRVGGLVEAIAEWRSRWPQGGEDEAAFGDVRQRGPGRVVDFE